VFESNGDVARNVAQMVANTIRERNSFGQNAVLGLAAESALVGVYRELARMHRDEGLDMSRVVTFNVGEYYGLDPKRLQSFHRWMADALLKHVNVPAENVHLLDGTVDPDDVDDHCRRFEEAVRRAGGIDLQLLGVGRNGRIGFNEPFAVRNTRTRTAVLDPMTRKDAAGDFYHEENVPNQALTMGIGTILEARKIILMAFGEDKARIVREAAEGPTTDRVPASFLQEHGDASFLLDLAAAAELTGVATPWSLGNVEWTDPLIKRAVLWLCRQAGKALLKLDGDDFREHNLHQLLRHHGPSQRLAHRVFRWMMDTIEYHPAGREPGRALLFSPHPDDDVISMGGTMIRLVEDEHELHVAYMTSGNIAVFDHDAQRLADLLTELNRRFGIDEDKTPGLEARVLESLAEKTPGDPDSHDVLGIKELIRWSEAKSAAVVCGCREEHLHFLDLPFYRTGTVDKRPPGADDVEEVRRCIDRKGRGRSAGGAALSRGLAGMASARDRHCRPSEPSRREAQETGDLPARVAKGRGPVPRPRRPPRVLAAGRRPQPPHGRRLQPDRPARVLCHGGLRAMGRQGDLNPKAKVKSGYTCRNAIASRIRRPWKAILRNMSPTRRLWCEDRD
jgi:glucosamine-6-phosphate deaminase